MNFRPKNYKILSFDIFGTLIDWETGINDALLPLLSELPASSIHHPSQNNVLTTRKFILSAYTTLELSVQKEEPTLPYPKVLASVYEKLASQLSIPITAEEAAQFGSTIGSWPAFPDTVAAMQALSNNYKLIVLSNVDRSSFSQTLYGPLKGVEFDAIYTAEDIGSYKPNLRNFQYLVDHAKESFGAEKKEILHVAQSIAHDHKTAKKAGFEPTIWIKRRPRGEEALMGGDWEEAKDEVNLAATFGTLGEFAEAVEKGL
ncbi:hypothetical protein HYALB_00007526 [Hymenoscyphus albidus]|uniref:Haloacid dehalogenase n=1 Tax=Hymenoscyphus albidus TaxID=595503 RepID=A0A9N9M1K2_9HELO|nr:hypothetical protein HYALB_00007526 [Hymenoscyphus albidus]